MDVLLRTHYGMVRAVCHRIVLNHADADDATQAALMSIVRALPKFDGRAKFSTWAYRIAVNAALDEVRRIRRRPMPSGDPTTGSNHNGSPFAGEERDAASAIESQMVVRAALEAIPEEYRVALVLRHIADLDYEEIAVILDVPIGTVRSRLSRGRDHLERVLGNSPDSPERHIEARSASADPTDPREGGT